MRQAVALAMKQDMIFKIVTKDEWRTAQSEGVFKGAGVDLEDGFIHFSTAAQVEETARRHFNGKSDLLLVAVEPARLADALKYEPSRGGALFSAPLRHPYAGRRPVGKAASVR